MASTRLIGETFEVLGDGRITIPSWGTELLCVLMIFTPNSWKEIASRLRTLPQFVQNLDEYSLVYSFCMAMIVRDPILLGLVSYDPPSGNFSMIPAIQAIYGGEPNPLAFWATPQGHALKNTVSHLMASSSLPRQNVGEAAVHDRAVEEFRRQVDEFSSNRHSRLDWVVLRPVQRATYLSRVLVASYAETAGSRGLGDGTAEDQDDGFSALTTTLVRDLRGLRLSSTPAVGLDNYAATANSTLHLPHDPLAESRARTARVVETVETWRRPYPEGLGETCCICLEEMPVPAIAKSCPNDSVSTDVLVRTPCNHYFGVECIKVWLLENDTCPLCRRVIIEPGQCVAVWQMPNNPQPPIGTPRGSGGQAFNSAQHPAYHLTRALPDESSSQA